MTDPKSSSAAGRDDPALDPFEIEFKREFRENRGPREPFINSHGVVIGDHDYESPNSPLEQWSEETDPAVMAGDEWVHPFKDIGFRTEENRDLFEEGIPPQPGAFMHPTHQTADLSRIADNPLELEEEYETYFPVPEVLDEP
ncbi:DUF3905 domain-containing protein [Cohnella sp. AR92]|uniref:DUF3905 domain-containing protein n=1 Tax=Cohnella sp. AR92 TaxID=648716 RepID=UPI000F8C6D0E|nr:DUF3905 domain-containing protein [Cohnella sp. AR92]RUS46619.1 DUF3905 domain-containing protein [Cohnella sp. AR92]